MHNRFISAFKKNHSLLKIIETTLLILGLIFIALILSELIYGYLNLESTESGEFEGSRALLENPKYSPYLGYISRNRDTKNKCGDGDAARIFTFGGSTMWGMGVDYENTIASNISEVLCDQGFNVKVSNYGQLGYVSTQEKIYLLKLLRDKSPDVVVFYDGVNDPAPDRNPGGLHMDPTRYLIDEFMYKESPMRGVSNLILSSLLEDYHKPAKNYMRREEFEEENLGQKIVDIYFHNLKIVSSLEDSFNFNSLFYWQPSLATRENPSDAEKEMIASGDHDPLLDAYQKTNKIINEKEHNFQNFNNLMDIFNDREEHIYLDDCHKKPIGNRIVAKRIANDIADYLN